MIARSLSRDEVTFDSIINGRHCSGSADKVRTYGRLAAARYDDE